MRIGWMLMVLVGCGLPDPQWVGEHVELAADQGLKPCGDAVGHMDAYVDLVAAALGVPAPTGDDRISFYWLHAEGFAERTVCVHEGACSVRGNVYSSGMPLDHELVHTLARGFGTSSPFFLEGLAVAFEVAQPADPRDAVPISWYLTSETPIAAAIESREGGWLPPEQYPLAGAFTAFLIERHGIAAVLRVYSDLGLTSSVGRISRVFNNEFGESLAAAEAAFMAEVVATNGRCPLRAYRLKVFECAAPEILWDGQSLRMFETLSCDTDGAVGPFGGGDLAAYRTLEVPAGGMYEVSLIGDAGAGSEGRWNRAVLVRCGGCEGYAELTISAEDAVKRVEVPAGRYSVQLLGPVHVASGVGLRVERAADERPKPADEGP